MAELSNNLGLTYTSDQYNTDEFTWIYMNCYASHVKVGVLIHT